MNHLRHAVWFRLLVVSMVFSCALMLAVAGCASGTKAATPSTTPSTGAPFEPPAGLRAVRVAVCTVGQLRHVDARVQATRVVVGQTPGQHSERSRAIRIRLNSLLEVRVRHADTTRLTITRGCWVKSESHLRRGVMHIVFLMVHPGYTTLASHPPDPYGGGDWVLVLTYLRVVR